ncbi:MAG: MBL fold metallo-hydrolase [Acidobacteriota bacterium]
MNVTGPRRTGPVGTALLLSGLAWLAAGRAVADETPRSSGRPERSAGRFVRLTERAWAWVAGDERSSNGALFVGDRAALAVDPGLTPSIAVEFLKAAREITPLPIRDTILTHWHPDHAIGAICLPERFRSVAAHPRTRRALAERGAHALAALIASARGAPERRGLERCRPALPDPILADRQVFDLGSYAVEALHPGPAHTRGDLIVWSPRDGVLVTGDLFMRDSCPSMGEGSVLHWIEALGDLIDLRPRHVVPGHFAPGTSEDLKRFRDYLGTLVERVEAARSSGVDPGDISRKVTLPEFASFRQVPQYGATFEDNAVAVARELAARPARPGVTAGFRILARIDAGESPHQIAFAPNGEMAYVAAAGSDRVSLVDTRSRRVTRGIKVPGAPLGVAVPSPGTHLLVSLFSADQVLRLDLSGDGPAERIPVGGAPSLLVGSYPERVLLISAEKGDRLAVIDAGRFALEGTYPTGGRPFPAAATSDGRLAFVPNHDDGTLTVVDLWNRRVVDTVRVGERPSGGTVLPGDIEYAVALRGEDRLAFVNTASHEVVGTLSEGIGRAPFSVVLSADGRLAFVSNGGSRDVSVLSLPDRRAVARIPVGEVPIVMAVHPSGETLWVSSEGAREVSVIEIPARWRGPAGTPRTSRPPAASGGGAGRLTEVAVLGTIHAAHRASPAWGLDRLRDAIRRLSPDVVCAEIPPDRWERIWSDFSERGVVEDPRIVLFPEYTEVLLPLAVEMGFDVIPCAAWTKEMSDLRRARIRQFETGPAWAEKRREYDRRLAELRARYDTPLDRISDPLLIHSERYDLRTKEELSLYDEYLGDWIGPGGWTRINRAHMKLIDRALRTHRGKRMLIMFGAAHKYWLREQLRARRDVRMLDVRPFLSEDSGGLGGQAGAARSSSGRQSAMRRSSGTETDGGGSPAVVGGPPPAGRGCAPAGAGRAGSSR